MIIATGTRISLNSDMSNYTELGDGGIGYTFLAENLTPSTMYYVQSWATNERGTGYSTITSVTTSADVPVVTALGYTNITNTGVTATATASGSYYQIASYTFKVYASDGSLVDTITQSGNSVSITGLTPNTVYSIGVVATNTNGDSSVEYGGGTFTTTYTAPTVTINSFGAPVSPTAGVVNYTIVSVDPISVATLYIDTNSDFSTATTQSLTATTGSGSADISISTTSSSYYVKIYVETTTGLSATSSTSSIEPLANVTITNIAHTDTTATVVIAVS